MSCKETSHERNLENNIQFEMKNNKNDIFKNYKKLKNYPQKTQNLKIFKKVI